MFYKEILFQSFFLSLIQLVTCIFFVKFIQESIFIMIIIKILIMLMWWSKTFFFFISMKCMYYVLV